MIQQGGVDIQNAGAVQVPSLAFNEIPGIATGDLMLAYVAVRGMQGGDVPFVITAPFGWVKIGEFLGILFGFAGVRMAAYAFHKTASQGAPYNFVFDSPRECVGFLARYYDDTGLQVRAVARSQGPNGGPLQPFQDAPSLNSVLSGQRLVCFYAVGGLTDTWTPDALQTEIADANSFTGSGFDISAMLSDEALAGIGATGIRTATLDGGVGGGMSMGISTLLTAGGVLLSGGTFTLYDNAKAADGVKFNPDELVIGYPNNCQAEGIANYQRYKFLGAGVTLGSAAGSAATTFAAKDCVIDAGGNAWTTFASNLGSWTWEFGERSGSGDDEVVSKGVVFINIGNKTFRGNWTFFGCTFVNQIAGSMTLAFQNQLGGLIGEFIGNTIVFDSNGAGGFTLNFGQAGVPVARVKRNRVFARSVGGTFCIGTMFATEQDDLEIEAVGFGRIIDSALASAWAARNVKVRGSVTSGTIRWGSASNGWRFSGFRFLPGPKFVVGTSGVPSLANATKQDAIYTAKIVNEVTGAALAGIPFKITEYVTNPLGNVLVDAVSDANGRVVFSSGQTLNAVPVADYYAVGTVATMRHRGPFTFEVNTGPSANLAYGAKRRVCDWPSDVPVTISAGNFEDVNEVIGLSPPIATSDETAYADGEIDVMLAEFGQDVSVAGIMTKGIIERKGTPILERGRGVSLGIEISALIKTGTLPVQVGAEFSGDGEIWIIREVRRSGDGAVTRLMLAEE